MKGFLVFAAIFVIIVIIAVTVFIVIKFSSLEQTIDTQVVTGDQNMTLVERYVAEKYPNYAPVYDAQNKVLTLQKQTDFSIDSAPNVYTDATSYLSQVQILALDISTMCNEPELTVVLCYLSKDAQPMYSVASNGVVTKYWLKSAA